MTEAENMEVARQLAAQAWCELETEMIEMDVRLAEAFAKRIAALNTTIENLRASHDLPRLQDVAEINALRARCEAVEAEVEKLGRESDEERDLFDAMKLRALAAERSRDEARAEVERYKTAADTLQRERDSNNAHHRDLFDRLQKERDEAREALREASGVVTGLLYGQPMDYPQVIKAGSWLRRAGRGLAGEPTETGEGK